MGATGVKWGRAVTALSDLETVAQQGFDAAELPVAALMESDSGDFQEAVPTILGHGVSFEVFSAPLPPQVRVTEQGFNIYVWSEYLKRALDRVAALGGRRVVWSEGRSRIVPIEGEVGAAKRQALQFLFMLGDIAGGNNIEVLVEPLDPRRTNFLNTMDEVLEFLELVGRPNLSSVVSFRDLDAIGFGVSSLDTHADSLRHVYLENPESPPGERLAPLPGDVADYDSFLAGLAGIGYSGNITLPHGATADSLDYCRSLFV